MAAHDSTRPPAGPSDSETQNTPDAFDELQHQLLVEVSHVKVVAQRFGDLSGLSAEDAPAGLVLCEAARALDALYDDLDSWHVQHEHTPKARPLTLFARLAVLRSQAQGIRAGIEQLIEALPERANPEGEWDPDSDMANQLESAGKDADSLIGYLTPEDDHVDRELPAGTEP